MTRILAVGSKDKHLRQESYGPENRLRSFAVPLRRHWIVILGSLLVPVESLRKGVDTYYDFLNIKWVMGWMLSNGNFNLKGIASTRKWSPPYLDIWNSIWASAGPWWLPNIIHGLAHLLVVPSVFVLARRVAPQLPNLIHQLVSVVAVIVPLVRMQVGTSTGHLYATLPLIWALSLLLAAPTQCGEECVRWRAQASGLRRSWVNGLRTDKWIRCFLAGTLLAFSPLLKPSVLALVPAHLVAVPLLVGSVSGTAALAHGFAATYLFGAVGWAVVVAVSTGLSPLNVQSPALPLAGLPLVVLTLMTVVSAAIGLVRHQRQILASARKDAASQLLYGMTVSLVGLALVGAEYLRRARPDYRWLVPDFASLRGRLLHAGDLNFGYLTVDLESAYFDTSVPTAVVLLLGACFLFPLAFRKSIALGHRRALGVVVFVALPLVYNMWATGYTRYGSQVVPLVGVAGIAFFTLFGSQFLRLLGSIIVIALLCLPMLLTNRASAEVPRFGQVAYDEPIFEDFVSESEINELNNLLPAGATVLAVGDINTYLLPQLGRTDLEWLFWKPSREEVAEMSGNVALMFNPSSSDELVDYPARGLLFKDCSVLRFRRTSVGLCSGSVDPALRSAS